MKPTIFFSGLILVQLSLGACAEHPRQIASGPRWDAFLDTLQVRTIKWFLDFTPESTGLTPDRSPTSSPSSIAAVGFALTAYPIASERKTITRNDAAGRTLTTLRFLWQLPQDKTQTSVGGYKGFFYHFIDTHTGLRAWNCELSTIDTALLLAG